MEEEKEEEGLDVYEHTTSRPLCKIKIENQKYASAIFP